MSLAGYEALVALGREELDLARAGDLDGVERVQAERGELIAALPAAAPAEARPHLREASALQSQSYAVLEAASREASDQLGRTGTGRRAARSYTPHMPHFGALDERG